MGTVPKSCVVVLPTLNESDAITAVLGEILEASAVLELVGCSCRVVIVDDGSTDGTVEMAQDFAASVGLALDVDEGPKDGLGAAVLAGLRIALQHEPSVIVCLDADGQHDARDIPTLIRAHFARRSDITIGSRWTRGGRSPGTSKFRLLGSRSANVVFRGVTGTRGVTDATTAFRVLSPRVAKHLLDSNVGSYRGYAFFSACISLAEGAGYSIAEVPITFRPRYGGTSKLTPAEVRRFFASLTRMRRDRRVVPERWSDDYLAAEELELLGNAHRWQALLVECATAPLEEPPRCIVEIGAGHGAVLQALRNRYPDARLVAVEPDGANFTQLALAADQIGGAVEIMQGTLDRVLERADLTGAVDLLVYVNVLEHIEDDIHELERAARVLRPGGAVAVVVPALQGIYGPVDARSGHFRRYDLRRLRSLVEAAGLELRDARYLDPVGVVPYWLYFRFLNRASFSAGSINVFDRLYVPVIRRLQRPLRRLPGKTAICVAARPY